MGYTLWLCQNSYWKWPFIVDFPIKHGDFPVRYVKLPEGKPTMTHKHWGGLCNFSADFLLGLPVLWDMNWLTGPHLNFTLCRRLMINEHFPAGKEFSKHFFCRLTTIVYYIYIYMYIIYYILYIIYILLLLLLLLFYIYIYIYILTTMLTVSFRMDVPLFIQRGLAALGFKHRRCPRHHPFATRPIPPGQVLKQPLEMGSLKQDWKKLCIDMYSPYIVGDGQSIHRNLYIYIYMYPLF